jgi:hypothetical protein
MQKIDWHIADQKLSDIIRHHSRVDVYLILNIVAPLRLRLRNGERTVRLYNQIMNLRTGRIPVKVPAQKADPETFII